LQALTHHSSGTGITAPLNSNVRFILDMEYQSLLARAFNEADEFSLVWREEFKFQQSALSIDLKLSPFLISEQKTSSWPGTDLFGGFATLKKYSVSRESIALLNEVKSVYEWLAPKYPEDLAFYNNGKVLFWSIAHESEAGFA